MPESASGPTPFDRRRSVVLWDMAGTLLPYDARTGQAQPLPGAAEFLPEIAREFRQVVTTGDETAGARNILQDFEMLGYFEEVFGGLLHPVGKPYGAILKHLGAEPDFCVVVGDRLRADLPADTDRLLTILINQGSDVVGAGMIAFVLNVLRAQKAAGFCAAFDRMLEGALPQIADLGPRAGGTVTRAGLRNDGFNYRLWLMELAGGLGSRRIILL